MSYEIDGWSLATVRKISSRKDSQLFQMPMPASDSSAAVVLDLFGASRTIIINCTYMGTEDECKIYIGQLDNLVNGNQSVKIFHSDISPGSDGSGNYNVYVLDIQWEYVEAAVGYVNFSISLMECSPP